MQPPKKYVRTPNSRSSTRPKKKQTFAKDARRKVAPKTPTALSTTLYPIRINRYLASKGYTTRRGADEFIEQGLVKINGKVAKLGDQVEESDVIEISEKVLAKKSAAYRYVAYHKPRGVSTDTQPGSQSITSELPALRGLYPLGRLDKESHGLIILTNDGRLTDRLLHPDHAHEKEYRVKVDKPVTDRFIRHLERGVVIEGYKTKPAKARRAGETIFAIILTEGKKHQIRRMCAADGYQVRELTRVRVMNVKLGDLKEGAYRDLTNEERVDLFKKIGL